MLALTVAAAATAAIVLAALVGLSRSGDDPDRAKAGTATATVARRDLVQRSTVAGTLGYGDPRNVVNYRRGTITGLPREGSVLQPGDVLYRVDEEPVVLFSGGLPAWRPLAEGVSEGRDVRQLERNLRALGYDGKHEMRVDGSFTPSTAAAVGRWQADVGLPETGRVERGAVFFLPGARRIGTVAVSLGDPARPGALLLATFSTTRLVTAEIDAVDQGEIAAGDKVVIDLLNGTSTTGTIAKVGKVASLVRDEANGARTEGSSTTPTIAFEVRPDRAAVGGGLDQAPVEVAITSELVASAVSVPVTALLALRGGGYGVELVRAGTTAVVAVTPGLYSDGGFVEIERGEVEVGDVVVVPA